MYQDNTEPDLIEMEDDNGGTVTLRVEKYFFYNGDEYVLLNDDIDGTKNEAEISRYVMRVQPLPEEGEDMEEFVPVEPEIEDRLIHAARVTFRDDDDDEEEE